MRDQKLDRGSNFVIGQERIDYKSEAASRFG